VLEGLGVAGFALVIVGGALFSFGAVCYALHRPNPWPRWFGYHEIFHLFVIAGVAVHYVAVAFFAVPQASA
jgi:hemolysin III